MNSANRPKTRKQLSAQLDDIESLIETFSAAPARCIQTTPGILGARIHDVSTQRIELRDSSFAAGIIATISDPLERFTLGIALSGDTLMQGVRLTSSNFSYVTGRNGAIAQLAPGSRWCNLSFQWELLHCVAETHNYRVPSGDSFCGMPIQARNQLAAKLSRTARGELYADLSDAELEDELTLSILRVINAQKPAVRSKRDTRQRNVHRVIDFIEAEFSGSVTVTGLCQLTGVNERTLQYQFKNATGVSIQRFLMAYRLQRARALLLRGEYAQISEAANACGFHHMGRFAQYYNELFGQFPRENQIA